MSTSHVAFAVLLGVAMPGGCQDFWKWHGHGHGHDKPRCDEKHGHKHEHGHKHKHCEPEPECTAAQYEGADGQCHAKATALTVGNEYGCAVLEGGGLKCWGSNGTWGVLGYAPSTETRGDAPGEMGDALPLVPLGAGLLAVDAYAASDVTCALIDGGRLKCWGYNGYGVVTGVPGGSLAGLTVADYLLRTFASPAVEIAAGSGEGMVLHEDGTLSRVSNSAFSFALDGAPVAAFDRSSRYDDWDVCAVTDAGALVCRQFNDTPADTVSIELGTGRTAIDVALGERHACALLDDGGVKCWGDNGRGQLGQGDTLAREPNPGELGDALPPIALGQSAVAIASGHTHACAILADGSVKCWGSNDQGQLGIGSTHDMGDAAGEMALLPAVDLGTGRTAVAIDAGTHTCALLDNGGIKCWGGNDSGQLGQGDTTPRGTGPGQLGDALPEIDLGS